MFCVCKGSFKSDWQCSRLISLFLHTTHVVGERVQGYLQAMLEGGPTKKSPSMPPALRLLSAEVAELGMAFGRIVHFNRSVFGPFYVPILRKKLFPSGEAEMGEDSR